MKSAGSSLTFALSVLAGIITIAGAVCFADHTVVTLVLAITAFVSSGIHIIYRDREYETLHTMLMFLRFWYGGPVSDYSRRSSSPRVPYRVRRVRPERGSFTSSLRSRPFSSFLLPFSCPAADLPSLRRPTFSLSPCSTSPEGFLQPGLPQAGSEAWHFWAS